MNKVVVEVNTTRLETATMIKNNLVELLKERLFPLFNKKMDKYSRPGKVMRLHDLTLNLTIPRDDYLHALETGIIDRFSRAIENKLSGSTNPSHDKESWEEVSHEEVSHEVDKQITVEENRREQFLYFLEKGHLPWYGNENDLRDLLLPTNWEESLDNPVFFMKLVSHLERGEETINRFIYQLDDRQITAFMQRANPTIKEASAPLLQQLHRFPRDTRNRLIHFLLAASLEKGNIKSIYGRTDILPLQRSDHDPGTPFPDKRNHPNEVGEEDKPNEKNRTDERNRSGKKDPLRGRDPVRRMKPARPSLWIKSK